MVLDIRQEDEPQPTISEEVESTPQLEDLLITAAAADTLAERARAVEQLRQLVPGSTGTNLLWSVMEQPENPRRLVAAQLLGYHRRWISSAPAVERLLRMIRSEPDAEVAAALVWGLRQKDEIQEFIFRDQPTVAREAALGLPINSATIGSLISYLFAGQENENRRILLEKLRTVDPRLVKELGGIHLTGVNRIRPLALGRPPRPMRPWALQARGMPTLLRWLGGHLPRPSAGDEVLETQRFVADGQFEQAIEYHAAAANSLR